MDEQTRKLLEECTSGCKMAVSSIQQILEFTQDSALQKILNKYIEQHTHLQQTAESQLSADGFEPKDPGMLASAFSWFTTEIKLGMNSDNSEIAKVLIDAVWGSKPWASVPIHSARQIKVLIPLPAGS